jgi:hypothetical protein
MPGVMSFPPFAPVLQPAVITPPWNEITNLAEQAQTQGMSPFNYAQIIKHVKQARLKLCDNNNPYEASRLLSLAADIAGEIKNYELERLCREASDKMWGCL